MDNVHVNSGVPASDRSRYAKAATSPKALGVACAFFGILLSVGAVATLSSGRMNLHSVVQVIRGGVSVGGGVMLFALSAQLLKKSRSRRS